MWLDLVAEDGTGKYNRKFAAKFGLVTAVYWAELCDVLCRVKEKETFDDTGLFTLDREYVKARTTLTIEQQLEADSVLTRLGVISKESQDQLRVNVNAWAELVISDNTELLKEAVKSAKKATKEGKADAKCAGRVYNMLNVVKRFDETDEDLYKQWCEMLYSATYARITNQSLEQQVQLLMSYANNDQDLKQFVLDIAIRNNYKDINWAINIAKKQFVKKQTVATGLSNIAF